MKVYVVCDLEGVAGVIDHRQQCQWDLSREWFPKYYDQARRLATLELNAAVEGALEGGADEVVAWDGHGNFPGGLDVELLHPGCKLVMGAGDAGPEGMDGSFDALFQCGLHGMAGSKRGILAHSFWGGIASYSVNDVPVGEIWMNSYTAGLQDVPFVFLCGDRAAAIEARALVPELETAVVKESLHPGVSGIGVAPALSLAPEKARQVIREGARRAMGKVGQTAPLRVEPPFDVRVEFTKSEFADRVADRPGANRMNENTVQIAQAENPFVLL
jgi:D-amino peptidase